LTAGPIAARFESSEKILERPAIMRQAIFLIALAFVATTAQAQAVFRSVMPDGKIVYGDKPAPGAKESKQVNLPPPNISTSTQPQASPADAPAAAGSNSVEIAAARQNLEAAKKALEAGREPLEGERTGIARKGGAVNSQLNEAYFQRIQSLEQAVAAAQQQLDEAQRGAGR
jgi:hypothetical protein